MKNVYVCQTPIGHLTLVANAIALTEIYFGKPDNVPLVETPLLLEAAHQLKAYFAGELFNFRLPLAPAGTPFQQQVWQALCDIPYGTTISYKELATYIGKPSASRAVGSANNHNPLPIVIPCHRVIGNDGELVGYAGGLKLKQQLLDLERQYVVKQSF